MMGKFFNTMSILKKVVCLISFVFVGSGYAENNNKQFVPIGEGNVAIGSVSLSERGDRDSNIELDSHLRDKIAINPQVLDLTQFSGESVSLTDRSVSWNVNDVTLKGNGPTINLGRLYHSFQPRDVSSGSVFAEQEFGITWSLNIPKITFGKSQAPVSLLRGCGTENPSFSSGIKDYRIDIPGVSGFREIAQDPDNIDYPANIHTHYENNWLLICESFNTNSINKSPLDAELSAIVTEGLTLISPDGTKYHFSHYAEETIDGMFNTQTRGATQLARSYYISDIIDIHGNYIAFDYKQYLQEENDSVYPEQVEIDQKLLLSNVRGSDGREVTVEYTENKKIEFIKYNGKTVQYQYITSPLGADILDKVLLPENMSWEYKYYSNGEIHENLWGRFLKSIKTPYGAIIAYKYEMDPGTLWLQKYNTYVSSDGFDCKSDGREPPFGLTTRTVTVDGSDYNYIYSSGLYVEQTDEALKAELPLYDETKYHLFKSKVVAPDYVTEKVVLCGSSDPKAIIPLHLKVLRTQFFETDTSKTLLKKETQDWTVRSAATGTYLSDKTWAARTPEQVVINTLKVAINGNEYNNTYYDYDVYGISQLNLESNNINTKKKYNKQTYRNDPLNWMVSMPKIYSVSSDGISYTNVKELTYHAGSESPYDGLNFINEVKEYGQLKNSYTEYHGNGHLSKIEYNVPLTTGTGNRLYQLSDYYRGIPRTVTVAQRESASTMSITRKVNSDGLITSVSDFNNITTGYKYDDAGRLKSIDLPEDSNYGDWLDTLYTWSTTKDGNPKREAQRCKLNASATGCEGGTKLTITKTFDNALRQILVKTEDADGGTNSIRYQNFEYDSFGNQIFSSFVSSSATESKGTNHNFDALQRLRTTIASGRGTISQDYISGNKIRFTDALNNETTTTYQAFGAPKYSQPLEIISPVKTGETVTTTYSVNVLGIVDSVSQTGLDKKNISRTQTERYIYDSYKQICLKIRTDVGATAYGKNTLGETNWMAEGVEYNDSTPVCIAKPATAAISYVFDNLGDVKKINYPDTASDDVMYERDNNGNVLKLTAGSVEHTYNYNNQNILEDETLSVDQKSLQIDYGYNTLMHKSYTAYPDNTTVIYQPNAYGEATEAQSYSDFTEGTVDLNFASSALYYANGMLNSFTYGNGITHTTSQHATSLLPNQLLDTLNTTKVMDLTYTYDNNINVESITDGLDSHFTLSGITYDGLDRLTGTSGGEKVGNSTLTYDAWGNITTYSSKDSTLSYNYNYTTNHRLSSVEGASGKYGSFAYDNRGNITNNGERNFTFNRANQLIESGSNTYLYDGHNRRVKQTDSSGTSYSMYGQDGTLLYREKGSFTGNGTNYIYLGQKLVAKYGEMESPTNVNQNVENSRKHYKPFGDTIETEKTDEIGYTGHKFDKDLGLSYMQTRYYDPVIGRFYSNDPIGYRDVHSFNRYAYANNNPYKYVDPDGRLPIVPIIIFAAKELASEGIEQATGVTMPTLKNAGKAAARQLAKNKLRGKAGEKLTKDSLGDSLGGEQISFKNSKGKIARIDFTTKNKNLVETKTGNAKLSPNQKQLKADIDNGVAVTPVGKNAANAGFKPGAPVKIKKMEIDRHQ